MAELVKKERYTVRELKSGTKTVWEVQGRDIHGRRVRKRFDSPEKADGFKQLQEVAYQRDSDYRPKLTRLRVEELSACEAALSYLEAGESIVEAVRFYKKHYVAPQRDRLLREAVTEFVEDPLNAAHMRHRSIKAVEGQVLQLAHALPRYTRVHEITAEHVEAFATKDVLPQTARTKRNKISSFLNWALKRGYCGVNVVTGATRARERKLRLEADPEILGLDAVKALMAAAVRIQEGALRAYYAIHLFGGLRAEEVKRLEWGDVDLEEGHIRLGAGKAKTASRRIVEIPVNLRAWIEPCYAARVPIVPRNFQKLTIKVRKAAEIKHWVRDVARHTAVSYHYALSGDKLKTAAWAGNSPAVIDRHYRALVTRAQAQIYWAITPDNLDADNVVEMPEQEAAAQ